MLTNILSYKGYYAEIGFDDSADAFHGRVIGLKDVIDFYGTTPAELKQELQNSIDEYLAWCQEEGEEPDKTWSGKMTLRPSNEQHRRFIIAAAAQKKSVHSWMLEVLDRESDHIVSAIPHLAAE